MNYDNTIKTKMFIICYRFNDLFYKKSFVTDDHRVPRFLACPQPSSEISQHRCILSCFCRWRKKNSWLPPTHSSQRPRPGRGRGQVRVGRVRTTFCSTCFVHRVPMPSLKPFEFRVYHKIDTYSIAPWPDSLASSPLSFGLQPIAHENTRVK